MCKFQSIIGKKKRFTLSPKYKVNWTLKTIRLDFDVNFFEIQYYSKGQLRK
jgi:hypothetical protein